MNEQNETTPACCAKCSLLGDCQYSAKQCRRWILWFRSEWAKIRKAAAIIKKREEDKK